MNKDISSVKGRIFNSLIKENAFWSYEPGSVSLETISDDQLIALTLRYLDMPEIKELFDIYSFSKIKASWKRYLVPEGEYIYSLNRFFAWYLFGAKHPDSYLKSLETRRINALFS